MGDAVDAVFLDRPVLEADHAPAAVNPVEVAGAAVARLVQNSNLDLMVGAVAFNDMGGQSSHGDLLLC